jgi:hypothetical protein
VYVEKTYARSRASKEDQRSKVGSSLVCQGTGSIDEGSNTISLESASDDRATPSSNSTAGLLGLNELFLCVGGLSTVVGVTEDRGEDAERGSVSEDCAKGDSRRLNRREVWSLLVLVLSLLVSLRKERTVQCSHCVGECV